MAYLHLELSGGQLQPSGGSAESMGVSPTCQRSSERRVATLRHRASASSFPRSTRPEPGSSSCPAAGGRTRSSSSTAARSTAPSTSPAGCCPASYRPADPQGQGKRARLRLRRRHRRHHRDVRRGRLDRPCARSPASSQALRGRRRLRQGLPVQARRGAAPTSPGTPARQHVPQPLVNVLFGTRYSDLCYGYNAFWARCPDASTCRTTRPAERDGRLWGDGFEIETLHHLPRRRARLRDRRGPQLRAPADPRRDQPEHLDRRASGAAHAVHRVAPFALAPRAACGPATVVRASFRPRSTGSFRSRSPPDAA